MKKNKIKPHKGGRIFRLGIRITAEEKKMIEEKKNKYNLSFADLIIKAVQNYKDCAR
jgi:hypothetical protein